jgi:hypothetical protein
MTEIDRNSSTVTTDDIFTGSDRIWIGRSANPLYVCELLHVIKNKFYWGRLHFCDVENIKLFGDTIKNLQ